MIVSGYTLDLYCDSDRQHFTVEGFTREAKETFFHESKREAWVLAGRAGWTFKADKAFCPLCRKFIKLKDQP